MKPLTIFGILVFAFCLSLNAQDIHYSQFYLSPINLNPALSGVFNGDMRFAANYRSQWSSVPVPYTTTSGSFDGKIAPRKLGDNILGASLLFNYDQAGDSRMGLLQLGGALAYTQRVTERNFISLGFQMGGAQRRFHTDKLTFDSQYNGDIFDPNLSSQEVFPQLSFYFLDFSVGANWHFQLDERTKFDAGVALHHLNEPQQSFFADESIRLAKKISFNWDASIRMGKQVDVLPAFIYQIQGTYQETVLGLSFKYYMPNQTGKEIGLLIGTWLRPTDAIIPSVGIQYNNLRVGLSYDVNTSPLKIASNRNGGPEIGLIYIISKVKSAKSYKSCPIF